MKKIILIKICLCYVGMGIIFSQGNGKPPIDFIYDDDLYKGAHRPANYIDLPAGTIIARDTSKIV